MNMPASTSTNTDTAVVIDLGLAQMPRQIDELLIPQIAGLPLAAQAELSEWLEAMGKAVTKARAQMQLVLDSRYGELARTQLHADGRDTGTTHLRADGFDIAVEIKKSVAWDQAQLSTIAQRIAATGDPVSDYIDITYAIPESRFNAWPSTLKESFAKARTVKPGKPVYRIQSEETPS